MTFSIGATFTRTVLLVWDINLSDAHNYSCMSQGLFSWLDVDGLEPILIYDRLHICFQGYVLAEKFQNLSMCTYHAAYMIQTEGPEYPEYVMQFLPVISWDPQNFQYVR